MQAKLFSFLFLASIDAMMTVPCAENLQKREIFVPKAKIILKLWQWHVLKMSRRGEEREKTLPEAQRTQGRASLT